MTETWAPRRRSRWKAPLVAALALLFVLASLCIAPGILQMPLMLLVGWVFFLVRTLGRVAVEPMALVTAIVLMLAAGTALHGMCWWMYRGMADADPRRRWPLRWTAAILAVLALMFVSGFAMAGVARQTLGLLQSRRPILADRTWYHIYCLSNINTIWRALDRYAQGHDGRFPDRLEGICGDGLVESPNTFICLASDDEPASGATAKQWATQLGVPGHLSYTYIGQGLMRGSGDGLRDRPILYESLSNHGERGVNILFGDGDTRSFSPEEAEKILRPWTKAVAAPATAPVEGGQTP